MKKEIGIIILLLINLTIFGQHNLGLEINGGMSKIKSTLNSVSTNQEFQFMPSVRLGLFYNLQIGKRSKIEAKLLFIQIEGKEKMTFDATDQSGNPTGGLAIDNIWKHISYIGIPIYYGFKINKTTINLGIQASFLVKSSGREKGQSPYNGRILTWDNKFDELGIDNYDYGPTIGLTYRLTENFSLEGTYYYGVNNILNNDITLDWAWRVQQITIGLKYTFLTIPKNEK